MKERRVEGGDLVFGNVLRGFQMRVTALRRRLF